MLLHTLYFYLQAENETISTNLSSFLIYFRHWSFEPDTIPADPYNEGGCNIHTYLHIYLLFHTISYEEEIICRKIGL